MATNSELGIRVHTEKDGIDGYVQTKDVGHATDATLAAAAQFQVIVDAQGNKHVEVHGDDPGGTDRVLRTSEQGSASVDGVYHGTNNTDPSQTGIVGMVRNTAPADSQQTLRVTAVTSTVPDTSIRSMDIALHDEAGNPYSATNPLPVTLEESEGTEVHDYKEDAAVAADASVNHNYTVLAGTTFILHQVICDASGDAQYTLQIGDGGGPEVFTTKASVFTSNGKAHDIELKKGITVTAGASNRTVRVVKTNLDNQTQDLHTTIVGVTL